MNYYTGIGSRETPYEMMKKLKYLGKCLAKAGFILRSGGADGADSAFEEGCDLVAGGKDIYLPWARFNQNPSSNVRPSSEAIEMASQLHPSWLYLKDSVKLLHARNCHQVLGQTLSVPSEFTVCWTADGAETLDQLTSKTGGTATAIRLSLQKGVPVFNLKNDTSVDSFKTFVKDRYKLEI